MTELRVDSPRARRYDVDPGPDPQPFSLSCVGLTVGRAPEPPAATPLTECLALIGDARILAEQARRRGELLRADRLDADVAGLQGLLPYLT